MDAVSRRRYSRTRISGQPVEVDTTVDVIFFTQPVIMCFASAVHCGEFRNSRRHRMKRLIHVMWLMPFLSSAFAYALDKA